MEVVANYNNLVFLNDAFLVGDSDLFFINLYDNSVRKAPPPRPVQKPHPVPQDRPLILGVEQPHRAYSSFSNFRAKAPRQKVLGS